MSERIVVVTGGFGILGTAVAAAFAQAGDRVVRVDRVETTGLKVQDAISDLGGVDISDGAAATEAVQSILRSSGHIDVLVNVAGGFTWETLSDGELDTWHQMYKMNVATTVSMTKAALPALRLGECASIVNIGALAAMTAGAGMGSYAAAKAAVHRFTESLAAELQGEKITVNAVLPSIIDTPTNRSAMPDADFGSWVTPESIAQVIVFLASPGGRCLNGALIPVTRRIAEEQL